MRVIVADDSVLFREGLVRVLRDGGFEVVAQASNADELEHILAREGAAVVILDIRMPPTQTDEGLIAAKRIRRDHPEMAVLLLSQYVESHHALDLLGQSSERVGYLLKDRVADLGVFLDAVRRVGEGGSVVDPKVISQLLGRKRSRDLIDDLTERERSVLALMAEGRSNEAISAALKISPKTLEAHIGAVYSKLGLEPAVSDHRRVLAVLNYLRST
ncbi:MAG TPA: response regulator transcription factor [Candidatus Dormibacteraeota bacterium]|nr:response regulator transcription factor [Candidatus Dormibacteraeota bacterium]